MSPKQMISGRHLAHISRYLVGDDPGLPVCMIMGVMGVLMFVVFRDVLLSGPSTPSRRIRGLYHRLLPTVFVENNAGTPRRAQSQ
jgi:hypothetical protein